MIHIIQRLRPIYLNRCGCDVDSVSPMPCHITRGTVALMPHDDPHSNNRHPDTAMRRTAADKAILESEPEDVNIFTSLLTDYTYRKGKHYEEVNK